MVVEVIRGAEARREAVAEVSPADGVEVSAAEGEAGETGRRYVDYCMRPVSMRSQLTSSDWPCSRVLRRDFSRLGYARGDRVSPSC